jgi:hypothetical protein
VHTLSPLLRNIFSVGFIKDLSRSCIFTHAQQKIPPPDCVDIPSVMIVFSSPQYVYWPNKLVFFSYIASENLTNPVDIFYGKFDSNVGGFQVRWTFVF